MRHAQNSKPGIIAKVGMNARCSEARLRLTIPLNAIFAGKNNAGWQT
jgi:hypothetical protein